MGQITDDEAFRHVADSYRWLACAECSIVDLRWGFTGPQRRTVDAMLPNVAIALGASAVVYGRALTEFYCSPDPTHPNDLRSSNYFGFDPSASSDSDLAWLREKKAAMDVHLAHLTTNREWYEREGIDHVK